jgi:retinol dehydrogenase 12
MKKDLEGKIVLVTGATDGIGKCAALELARRGATITIVGRNQAKTERVAEELKSAGNYDRVHVILGDLSKLSDMKSVAQAFAAKNERLDILVNNAGAWFEKYQLTDDGIEQTFALNHMSYFVITSELLEMIRKTPNARVVSTSSGAHMMSRFDLSQVVKRSGWAGFPAYADSKLANILFTLGLAKRLSGTSAVANCFHPGFTRSEFGKNNFWPIKWSFQLGQALVARTTEKGAETLVWLATHPDAGAYSGQYFFDKKARRIHAHGDDDGLAEKLWDMSSKLAAGRYQ